MTYKALCNSCLRVVTFKTQQGFAAAHANEVSCVCGGDLCGCDGCAAVARDLESGNFAPEGVKVRMESWTAEGGAVGAVERNLQLEAYVAGFGSGVPNINQVFGKFGSKSNILRGVSMDDYKRAMESAAAKIGTEIHEDILRNGGKSISQLMRELFAEGLDTPAEPTPVAIKDIAARLGIKNVYVTKRAEPLNPELGHLSLTRRPDESVRIAGDVTVTVVRCNGYTCDIAFGADGGVGRVNYGLEIGTSFYATPEVLVRVADIKGSQVRLHFEAPRSIPIVRTELL